MRIGTASNANFSPRAYMSRGVSNLSNNGMSPLEKQKMQLEEQMRKINESKSSKESKDEAIKDLQKKLEEVEKQLMEEKAKELLEKPEIKEEKKTEQEKAAEEKRERPEVINKDVLIGIISASSHEKLGKVSYSVYKKAELKGDMTTAQRALRYTVSEMKKSSESRKLIQKGLAEYKKQMDNAKKDGTAAASGDNATKENKVGDGVDSAAVSEDGTNNEIKAEGSVKEKSK